MQPIAQSVVNVFAIAFTMLILGDRLGFTFADL
jgi:hypothetical protein